MNLYELQKKPDLIEKVSDIITQRLLMLNNSAFLLRNIADTCSGKMLRTRMAAEILGNQKENWPGGIKQVCAAVELTHTASLFHDDVIDGASLRRGNPTLWKTFSPNGSILIGDIILCEAIDLIVDSKGKGFLSLFMEKVREVCLAEAEQELLLRGTPCDIATCIRIARSKTGPLFALVGLACADKDKALAKQLEEAGYRIGTAYQLADDLIDETEEESIIGKTLGTDRLRRKFTLAQGGPDARKRVKALISELCESSIQLLDLWPDQQKGLQNYISGIFASNCQSPASPLNFQEEESSKLVTAAAAPRKEFF